MPYTKEQIVEQLRDMARNLIIADGGVTTIFPEDTPAILNGAADIIGQLQARVAKLEGALTVAKRDFQFLAAVPPRTTSTLQNYCDIRCEELDEALKETP